MSALPRRRFQTPFAALVALLAILGVLGAPVMARAGAELRHPHALLQLWLEAAGGVGHRHGPAGAGRSDAKQSADGHVRGHPGDSAPVRSAAPGVPDDLPTLDTAAQGGLAALVTVAVAAAALAITAGGWRRFRWPTVPRLAGLAPAPETPPPRSRAAAPNAAMIRA